MRARLGRRAHALDVETRPRMFAAVDEADALVTIDTLLACALRAIQFFFFDDHSDLTADCPALVSKNPAQLGCIIIHSRAQHGGLWSFNFHSPLSSQIALS